MSDQQAEMSFWDHLEELRWTILRSLIALAVFTGGGLTLLFYYYDEIILAPTRSDFITFSFLCKITSGIPFIPDFCDSTYHVELITTHVTAHFFTYMSSSFWIAVLITFPYLMYEVWKFVSPALYPNEKKNVKWVFGFGTVMFFIGCAVGYFIVFPMSLRFLAFDFRLSPAIAQQTSLESYMDIFVVLIFIMGIVFELPLVAWLLSQMGLLKRSFFNKYRRHAIIGLLIAAAFITPSGDPFTLMVVFIPLYTLYELSAFFVKKDPPKEEEEEANVVKHASG